MSNKIDLSVKKDRLERAVKRAKEQNIIIPTFAQMKNPALIPAKIKRRIERYWFVGFCTSELCSGLPGTTNRLPKVVDLVV